MFKYGLKLWSTNKNYIKEALRLYNKGVYSYIELYSVPGSFQHNKDIWPELNIPYVIHAAHYRGGMNLAKKEKEAGNMALIKEAQQFADHLNADKIIVHPGIDGDIKETARQLKNVNDKRIIVENKPYYALDDNLICNGATPKEIEYIINGASVGFCLDIGHAICTANALKKKSDLFLKQFILLNPSMFHLTDGDSNGVQDKHAHIGQGTFNFHEIMEALPADALITVETVKDSQNNLSDYEEDVVKIGAYGHN